MTDTSMVPTCGETPSQTLARGWNYHQAGKLTSAAQLYRHVLRAAPNHANALHLLGRVAFDGGDAAAAVSLMQQAVTQDPANAAFHHNLGLVHVQRGDLEPAAACFAEAVRRKPDYADAWNNLGNVRAAQRQFPEAVACYRRALEIRPEFDAAAGNLAGALRALGDVSGPLALLLQAATPAGDPGPAPRAVGDAPAALDWFMPMPTVTPNPPAERKRGAGWPRPDKPEA